MIAPFADGIEIPLHPFFGSMGVAPPASAGRISSAPPWVNAGNIDNKELVAGTTLFIPIHAPGALFQVGDGHAGQGDGEVDITAMETSLVGTFQFVVRKDMHLRWPRAETPTEFITMGLDEDLTAATKMAVREMIDFLFDSCEGIRTRHLYLCLDVRRNADSPSTDDGGVQQCRRQRTGPSLRRARAYLPARQ